MCRLVSDEAELCNTCFICINHVDEVMRNAESQCKFVIFLFSFQFNLNAPVFGLGERIKSENCKSAVPKAAGSNKLTRQSPRP